MQRPAQLIRLAFPVERTGGRQRIGVEPENRAVFRAVMIEAGDPPQVGLGEGFRRDRARHERPLQRLDGLLGRIERIAGREAQFAAGRGQ